MTLVIRSWGKWQKAGLGAVERSRVKRKMCLSLPYSMTQVVVAVVSDEHFMDFTRRSRRRDADALWLRVLRYAAINGALTGEIRVPPESFGRVVLSTAWDSLSRKTGEVVYEALVESGLCSERVPNEFRTGSRCSCSCCCSGSESPKPPRGSGSTSSSNGSGGKALAMDMAGRIIKLPDHALKQHANRMQLSVIEKTLTTKRIDSFIARVDDLDPHVASLSRRAAKRSTR